MLKIHPGFSNKNVNFRASTAVANAHLSKFTASNSNLDAVLAAFKAGFKRLVGSNNGDPTSIRKILPKDTFERSFIAQEAGSHAHPSSEILIDVLLKDSSPRVKATAARAIGEIKDPNIRDRLILKYAEHPDPAVRRGIAATLGLLEDPQQANKLIKKLMEDPDYVVRHYASLADAKRIDDLDQQILQLERLRKSFNPPRDRKVKP